MFSQRLITARKMCHMSQNDIAERSGLTGGAISYFETGLRKPSFDSIIKLAKGLEVTSDYLLGLSDSPKNEMTGLSFYERNLVMDYIKVVKNEIRDNIIKT